MSFKNLYYWLRKRRFPVKTIFIISLLALIYAFYEVKDFQVTANFIQAVTTLMFVYLTYETLMATRAARSIPYLEIEFIIASDVTEIKTLYKEAILMSDQFLQLERENDEKKSTRNIIFLLIKNIGNYTAIEASLRLSYEKNNLAETRKINRNDIFIGNLESGAKTVRVLEVFDNISEKDTFSVDECKIFFTDVNSKSTNEPKQVLDYKKGNFIRLTGAKIKFNQ